VRKARVLSILIIMLSFKVFADPSISDNAPPIQENVTVLGSNGNKWLVRIIEANNAVYLVDMKLRTMVVLPVDEPTIVSAKFTVIPYVKESLIEVIASTPKGDGSLYIFNLKLENRLKVKYFDYHYEDLDPEVAKQLGVIRKPEKCEGLISRIYRNNHVDVDYSNVKEKIIKVTGICDYVSRLNGKDTVIQTEQVEKYYKYSDSSKLFSLLQNISTVENEKWVSN
jgi:hypothetical protein